MARLETYTASGQTRSGPVAAGVPASVLTAPYEALSNVGGAIAQNGAVIAAIGKQRQQENDFRWADEAATNFKDAMIKWQTNTENRSKESVGDDYRSYADDSISEMLKASPNREAGLLFKHKVMPEVQRDYETNLRLGEHTRFENFKLSQVNGSVVDNAAYRARYDVDPDGAEAIFESALVNRLASIQATYGKTAPTNAADMSEKAVINSVLGVVDTDPSFARHVLEKHNSAVDPQTREVLLNKIEQAENNAKATGNFNAQKQVENSIQRGYDTLTPVPPPDTSLLSKHQKDKAVYDVDVANKTIFEYSKLKSWNWQEQQKSIESINTEYDPVAGDAKQNLQKLVAKAQKEQTEDPAGWQQRNDTEFARTPDWLNAIPEAARPTARMVHLDRMVSLQGYPPSDISEEQAKRYLRLPTGLQKATSVGEAKSSAAKMNNVPPNQLTQAVDEFDAQYPNPRLAAMAWNDMQNLPESDRLKMGIRVASAINDIQVRNNFLSVMSSKEVFKTEDGKAIFATELDSNDDYRRFVSGWIGDGNQRSTELSEFRDSILKYAESISGAEKLKTSAAIEKSVKRVITDNYGTMRLFGSDVPVYRFPKDHAPYSADDVDMIAFGITDLLSTISTDSIATDAFHFPLAPRLPGDQTEADQYLRKLIRESGTVVVEPDGLSATIYMRGEGENDFPFQALDKQGQPLLLPFDAALARGKALDSIQRQYGSPEDQQRRYQESLRRLGIPNAPKIRIKEVTPP